MRWPLLASALLGARLALSQTIPVPDGPEWDIELATRDNLKWDIQGDRDAFDDDACWDEPAAVRLFEGTNSTFTFDWVVGKKWELTLEGRSSTNGAEIQVELDGKHYTTYDTFFNSTGRIRCISVVIDVDDETPRDYDPKKKRKLTVRVPPQKGESERYFVMFGAFLHMPGAVATTTTGPPTSTRTWLAPSSPPADSLSGGLSTGSSGPSPTVLAAYTEAPSSTGAVVGGVVGGVIAVGVLIGVVLFIVRRARKREAQLDAMAHPQAVFYNPNLTSGGTATAYMQTTWSDGVSYAAPSSAGLSPAPLLVGKAAQAFARNPHETGPPAYSSG